MKNRKRILVTILAASMVASMSLPALATEANQITVLAETEQNAVETDENEQIIMENEEIEPEQTEVLDETTETVLASEETMTAPQLDAAKDSRTGIYAVNGQKVYLKDGERQYTTDVIKINGTWYNLVRGVLTPNTVAKNSKGWWYIDSNGKVDFTYTGIAKNSKGWWYCKGGKVQFGVNDVIKTTCNGVTGWYNIRGGKLVANTVAKNSKGWWYINSIGKVDFNYTGLAKNENGWWYIKKGKVDFSYTGMASNEKGIWYCQKGKVTSSEIWFSATDQWQGTRSAGVKGTAFQADYVSYADHGLAFLEGTLQRQADGTWYLRDTNWGTKAYISVYKDHLNIKITDSGEQPEECTNLLNGNYYLYVD